MSYDCDAYTEGWERTFGSKSERAKQEREFFERIEKRVREADAKHDALLRSLYRRIK